MWNAAHVREMLGGAGHFGFKVNGDISFDWHFLKTARDDYIKRLNSIYANNLKNSKVELLQGVRGHSPGLAHTPIDSFLSCIPSTDLYQITISAHLPVSNPNSGNCSHHSVSPASF